MKNTIFTVLITVMALSVNCDSPLTQEDSNKQMTEMSILAIAGASAMSAGTSATTTPMVLTGQMSICCWKVRGVLQLGIIS